jgi:hypothetical protein
VVWAAVVVVVVVMVVAVVVVQLFVCGALRVDRRRCFVVDRLSSAIISPMRHNIAMNLNNFARSWLRLIFFRTRVFVFRARHTHTQQQRSAYVKEGGSAEEP